MRMLMGANDRCTVPTTHQHAMTMRIAAKVILRRLYYIICVYTDGGIGVNYVTHGIKRNQVQHYLILEQFRHHHHWINARNDATSQCKDTYNRHSHSSASIFNSQVQVGDYKLIQLNRVCSLRIFTCQFKCEMRP